MTCPTGDSTEHGPERRRTEGMSSSDRHQRGLHSWKTRLSEPASNGNAHGNRRQLGSRSGRESGNQRLTQTGVPGSRTAEMPRNSALRQNENGKTDYDGGPLNLVRRGHSIRTNKPSQNVV